MSASWCPTHARTEELAMTLMAATTASASTGGRATTAARTSMTVPVQLVTTVPPAMTAWHLSSASVLMGAQVRLRPRRTAHWDDVPNEVMKVQYMMVKLDDELFSLCLQVCCATLMTPASATHVRRVPTVIPTQSMARQSAHVLQVTLGQPATWTLTSAPSVCWVQKFDYIPFACTNMTEHVWQLVS